MKSSLSMADAAEKVLRNAGEPLHLQVITDLILKQYKFSGKTPEKSVASCLAMNPQFKRVAEGTYALASWQQYPTARFAKDIAYDVLKKRGKPMKRALLGQKILAERKFSGGPSTVVSMFIKADRRFFLDKKLDVVGLVEWKNSK